MSEQNESRVDDRPVDDRNADDAPLSTADLAAGRPAGAEPGPDGGDGPQSPDRAAPPPAEPRSFEGRETDAASAAPVFPSQEADDLRRKWDAIQASFVDVPRRAVEDADHLVAATMQRLAESFAEERARLEGQWDRGDDVSTEDLRLTLQQYRSFFNRLLER